MEGSVRGSSSVAIQAIMLGVILLSCSSCVKCDFSNCYESCLVSCYLRSINPLSCVPSCLAHCIVPPTSSASPANDDRDRLNHYCELGCAYSLCSTISTINNPNVEAVEGCVKSCSLNVCTKYHH
ncbi:hypothetical protein Syun_011279 [Stephania yunnanensis]|uniref:Thionin-like protein 2 n=1 Tax=Stephania yunnanensis TaxID=152371 RepID=A0AAP0PGB6_9MAGN